MILSELILCHSDNLSMTLQACYTSVADATMTVKTLQSMRTDENFKTKLLQEPINLISVILYSLTEGVLRYYKIGVRESSHPEEFKDYRSAFFEARDLTMHAIQNQYDHQVYSRLESPLVKAIRKQDYLTLR